MYVLLIKGFAFAAICLYVLSGLSFDSTGNNSVNRSSIIRVSLVLIK